MLMEKTKIQSRRVGAKQIWKDPKTHYLNAIDDPWYQALFKLKADIVHHTHNFFVANHISAGLFPVTTGSISSPMGLGSDSKPVMVTIANVDTYLADSMQFMLEYALRFNKAGAYYIMPSFRGEHADKRHLCQFYHIEAEICGDLDDVMRLVNQYLYYLSNQLFNHSRQTLLEMTSDLGHLEEFLALEGNISRIRFDEAVTYLKEKKGCLEDHQAGFIKITDQGEQELIKSFNGPVWLTHFPKLSVPFYQADDSDGIHSMSADLLMGIGETVGSGQRHKTRDGLLKALDERQVSPDSYHWYLKMRDVSPIQTAGFGMGLERYILWLTRHDDIRDCQIIPRFNGIDVVP